MQNTLGEASCLAWQHFPVQEMLFGSIRIIGKNILILINAV